MARRKRRAALADQLAVNEPALSRIMRLLASQAVFEETIPRTFTKAGRGSYRQISAY